MIDKYEMKQEDNIVYANKTLIDSIYKRADLEGIADSFTEIKEF